MLVVLIAVRAAGRHPIAAAAAVHFANPGVVHMVSWRGKSEASKKSMEHVH